MSREYIEAQIMNMEIMVTTFEQSCIMAAQRSDGRIDREEEKILKRISAASKHFKDELAKIKR